jgi:hypothetical protein
MSIRKFGAVLAAICAALLLVPVAAGAKAPARSVRANPLNQIAVAGKASNGQEFTGHYTVDRFVKRHGTTYALGTLTGKVGNHKVNQSNVAIPVKVQHAGMAVRATCAILHLTLGPLDLNLLGLTIHLNQVVLNIDAVSGPGNLLGNLLCGVANLLNGTTVLSPGQLTGLLNILQQLLSFPALLSL